MYSKTTRLCLALGLLLSALTAACGSESDAELSDAENAEVQEAQDSVDPCPTPVSSLAQCFVGLLTAECGASAGPVLGCEPVGASSRCFWFSGSCMPPDFLPSACSTEDFCCSNPEPWTMDHLAPMRLLGMGTSPWSPERAMSLTVTEQPTLQRDPSFSPYLACNAAFELEDETTPCGDAVFRVSHPGTLLLSFNPGGGVFAGWRLLIELDPRSATARACQVPFHDVEVLNCRVEPEPNCASGGSVIIDRWPANADEASQVHGELQALFGEVQVQAQF